MNNGLSFINIKKTVTIQKFDSTGSKETKTESTIFSLRRFLNENLRLIKLNNQEIPW